MKNSILQSLAGTVNRHAATYLRAREREPLFAAHPTPGAVYDALAIDSGVAGATRAALLRAVVAEYQRGRHPLWYALAAQGLAPMLGRLRSRLHGPVDERDQAVHLAFAEELGRLRVARTDGVFPLLTLRRALERALFTSEADRQRERDDEEAYFEHAGLRTQQPHEDAAPFVACFAREVGGLLVERSGDDRSVRVLAGAETLGEQVERVSSERTTKACIRKRHLRTVERVRGDLSGRQS